MVWVVYITSGREKYVYETNMVGLFKEYGQAARALVQELMNQGRINGIFDPEKEDYSEEDYSEHEALREQFKCKEWCPDTIESFIKENDDSYFEDGWDYTIAQYQIIQ